MSTHFNNLKKTFESFRYKHDITNVFNDFLELAACSLSNSANMLRWEEREARYMTIIKRYTKDEANLFAEMLGMLVCALDEKADDYLGRLFMELELSDSWKGQFFTPYSVAYIMAKFTLETDIKEKIERGEIVRINDCAVGGGVTLIAAFEVIKEMGYNPQQVARFYAGDIDIRSVFMTYIQLSLLGAHATVWHMDTLTLQHWDTWLTPGVFLGAGQGKGEHKLVLNPTEAEPTPATLVAAGPQLSIHDFKDIEVEQMTLF